jgi:hypothetical protein
MYCAIFLSGNLIQQLPHTATSQWIGKTDEATTLESEDTITCFLVRAITHLSGKQWLGKEQ